MGVKKVFQRFLMFNPPPPLPPDAHTNVNLRDKSYNLEKKVRWILAKIRIYT